MSAYNKLWVALSAAIALTVKVSHGGFTDDEIDLLTITWLGVVGVWLYPNMENN
jgi:hypothetical protein